MDKGLVWVFMVAAVTFGCAGAPQTSQGAANPEAVQIPRVVRDVQPGVLEGYLAPEDVPDSVALLPPPPAEGSAGSELDVEASDAGLQLLGTPRWKIAMTDAQIDFPAAAAPFSCALDLPIAVNSPNLYMLLRRSMTDAGRATAGAKNRYDRDRPFEVNRKRICSPGDQDMLRNNGSYPSGHAAIGWAWALILAELAPDRADAILARGMAYGESRVICNVHWASDVAAGRLMGAAAVARLHGDPVFRAQLEAARKEVTALRAEGAHGKGDCAAEAAALGGLAAAP